MSKRGNVVRDKSLALKFEREIRPVLDRHNWNEVELLLENAFADALFDTVREGRVLNRALLCALFRSTTRLRDMSIEYKARQLNGTAKDVPI